MSEEIFEEEYNPLVRAISRLEGSLIALGLYWILLAILVFYGSITGDQFVDLVKDGTVILAFLKIIYSDNGNSQ